MNQRSEKFFDAIAISNDNVDQAINLLREFSETEVKSSEFNVILSLFVEAAIKREKKDFSGALNIYTEITSMNVDNFYIDFANLSAAETLISNGKVDAAIVLLESLVNDSSSLYLIAKEYLGYIEIKRDNFSKSEAIFREIYEDASASQGMKNRVKEILSVF